MNRAGEYTQEQAQAADTLHKAQMQAIEALRHIAVGDTDPKIRIQAAVALLAVSP